jgi:hypothetical protein
MGPTALPRAALAWDGPDDPGDWHPVTRMFRDGRAQACRAAEARLSWRGPDRARRLVATTADRGTLPDKATWYLVTSLPRSGGPREPDSPHPAASLGEIVRIYAIRNWTGQSCKQVKDELGWADFQVRSDVAIRRHQVLVTCALSRINKLPISARESVPSGLPEGRSYVPDADPGGLGSLTSQNSSWPPG